jgi:hypothetical protein
LNSKVQQYAFKVKVVSSNGYITYTISASTPEEAEKIAKELYARESVTLYVAQLCH